MANLYLMAHYDDEVFCAGRLFHEIMAAGHGEQIVILHVFGKDDRQKKFVEECLPQLNCFSKKVEEHYIDLEPLSSRSMNEETNLRVIKVLEELNRKYYFDKIYVPAADNHPDHCYVNQLAKIVFRPDRNSAVGQLLEFSVPGSDLGLDSKYIENTFFVINQRIMQRLEKYVEVYKDDLRGKNAYEHYKKKLIYNGSKVDGEYAETYHSVFHII